MNKERAWLLKEKYGGVESPEFFADLKRVEDGEPVDYVIGFSPFLGTKIDLSYRPLIPRTETEYWVEKAITECAERFQNKPIRILDVFSGSGCIGIAALSRLPNAQANFADIDESALKQIEKNCEINGISKDRYSIYKTDIFDGLPTDAKYNVIFANPPYISEDEQNKVGDSVKDYEPHSALFAEDNGLALIKKLVRDADKFLLPNGLLYIEHDDFQKDSIEAYLKEYPQFAYSFHQDQFGVFRIVRISYMV